MKYGFLIIVGVVAGIIIIGLSAILPYVLPDDYEFTEAIGITQVYLTAVGMLFLIITLIITLYQLRKSMAKPQIKVAFNENGDQQSTLIFIDGKLETGIPHPWIINEGNAIAKYFQIDFIIPGKLGKPSGWVPMRKNNGNYVLPYVNEGRYTLFVNRPYFNTNMIFSSAIDLDRCKDIHEDNFILSYLVYGDWAETQEGKLKIFINRQEAPHATTKS